MKTRKAHTKRFKLTSKGKIVYRGTDQNHFRAKKSGKFKRLKRRPQILPKNLVRQLKKQLP